jgi:hypothetical protein
MKIQFSGNQAYQLGTSFLEIGLLLACDRYDREAPRAATQ